MAWRPHEQLVEGELDNTVPGKVTGWIRFVGMKEVVKLDLVGDFHRDIRGTKVRLSGCARDNEEARQFLESFSPIQTGEVGDMTAGLPPQDYVAYPYFEWYSEANGRVVLELDPGQVEVIGRPIPAVESDPVSREKQTQNMARFLAGLSSTLQVPVILAEPNVAIISDPAFTHWVVEGNEIVGEARDVEAADDSLAFAFVRLFAMPEMAEYGSIESSRLQPKADPKVKGGVK